MASWSSRGCIGSDSIRAVGLILMTTVLVAGTSSSGTVDLPQTGQSSCWDASGVVVPCTGTGQDGDLRAGVAWPTPRFTANGDGTLTDELTGLVWLADTDCLGTTSWQGALAAVAAFNADPAGAGCSGYSGLHSDWRLANVTELESLVNLQVADSGV
jgi:hypothetical protein